MAGLNRPIRVAVDCMGGDHAPGETVAGALEAAEAQHIHVRLVGVRETLEPLVPPDVLRSKRAEIVHSDPSIPEGAPPLQALRAAPNASMAVTMRQVAHGQADAAVSASSTGPTLLAAVREIGMLKGVRRACVGRQILGLHPETFLVDLGPTMDCEARHLLEFAVIGATYMRVFCGIADPTVALLSNGHEPGKGNRVVKEAAVLLERSGLRFAGMVEGNHVMQGAANVVVCDGFVGNVALKTIEGVGHELARWLRREVAGALAPERIKDLATRLIEITNPIDLHGSLPLLGIRGHVVMAHGGSDRGAIQAAIAQAVQAVRGQFVDMLQRALQETRARLGGPVKTP
jgi:glycerol-3-phosphate acyltransferase PlsX